MNILPNGTIFGFALLNFNEMNNSLYVSMIGSHIGIYGAGNFLMKEIQTIGENLLFDKIQLESVEEAVSFYEKYGFTHISKKKRVYKMTKRIRGFC
jgi:predicted GNAT family N-acyltransferase